MHVIQALSTEEVGSDAAWPVAQVFAAALIRVAASGQP